MSVEGRTALHLPPEPLLGPLLVSLGAHLAIASFFFVAGAIVLFDPPAKPIIDPNDTLEVAMVAAPKSKSNLPELAMRAPRPAGEVAPAPTKEPPPPTPVRESDLAFNQPKPDPKPVGRPDVPRDMTQARAQALDDLMAGLEDAPIGPRDRSASDPNGVEGAPATSRSGGKGDPELAAYIARIRKDFQRNFHPLPAVVQANPKLKCTVRVQVDSSGRILGQQVSKPSGNPSYDRAAVAAVEALKVITPPPEKFRALALEGYEIEFVPQ